MLTGPPDKGPGTRRASEKRRVTLTPVTWVRPATLPRPPRRLRRRTTRGPGQDAAAATVICSERTLPNLLRPGIAGLCRVRVRVGMPEAAPEAATRTDSETVGLVRHSRAVRSESDIAPTRMLLAEPPSPG